MGQENWRDLHWEIHLVQKVELRMAPTITGETVMEVEILRATQWESKVVKMVELIKAFTMGCHMGMETEIFRDLHWESRNLVQNL